MDALIPHHCIRKESLLGRSRGSRSEGRICNGSYGNQALILQAWGRLEEALALHKQEEAICLELGNKDGLSAATATRR